MELLYLPLAVKIWMVGFIITMILIVPALFSKPPIEYNNVIEMPDENSYS